ncbi:MAG: response regulator [Campylobacterota bacterium]|nr:response regulator [Campylobacterota bacterium]
MKNCNIALQNIDKSKYNILIVEDSKTVSKITHMQLTFAGYNCDNAYTLKEAKELISKNQYNLILLDLHLPDGEGEELLDSITSFTKTRIIILTSDKNIELREYFYQFGILDYFNKSDKLIQIINEIDNLIVKVEQNILNKVLIVEDSKVVSAQLTSILATRNYQIIQAFNGSSALECLKNESIDLVILDMELPDIHGTQILHNIKIQPKFSKLPVIAMSGNSNPVVVREVLKSGAIDFLKKPLILEEFVLKVDIWIDYIRKDFWLGCERKILDEYKGIVDESNIVSKTDTKGYITYVNDKFCEISGYSRDELIGQNHNIVRHSDMKTDIYTDMWNTIQSKKTWSGKVKNKIKNGGYYWVDTTISPILDGYGEVREYIALRKDITEFEEAKLNIEKSNKKMKDSIEYASFIQKAIIPNDDTINKYFKDNFIIWEPKDVVGGDIYLINELRDDDECLLMVIDCTGHGVPGAFVTMIVKAIKEQITNKIIHSKEEVDPSKILAFFNKHLKMLLGQNSTQNISNVGFDGQIIYYNKKQNIIRCASARNEIMFIQNNELKSIKGDRHSVGYSDSKEDFVFKNHTIDISIPTKLYLASDGYWDQLGGDKYLPFGKKRFKEMLELNYMLSMEKQKELFKNILFQYQKEYFRNDDITLIGLEF